VARHPAEASWNATYVSRCSPRGRKIGFALFETPTDRHTRELQRYTRHHAGPRLFGAARKSPCISLGNESLDLGEVRHFC